MIIREFYRVREDGIKLYQTYSDLKVYIQKAGTEEIYESAIDVEDANYTYIETDIQIEEGEVI